MDLHDAEERRRLADEHPREVLERRLVVRLHVGVGGGADGAAGEGDGHEEDGAGHHGEQQQQGGDVGQHNRLRGDQPVAVQPRRQPHQEGEGGHKQRDGQREEEEEQRRQRRDHAAAQQHRQPAAGGEAEREAEQRTEEVDGPEERRPRDAVVVVRA